MQSRDTDTATLIPKLVPQPASKSLPTLLIVEDDENIRTQMKWALTQDYQVLFAGDRPQALALLRKEQPALVTLDLGLPPHPGQVTEGMAALAEMVESDPLLKIIIITGQAEKEHALQAVDQGAYDFVSKPLAVEELKVILRRALQISQLERENKALQQASAAAAFEDMLGTSPQMQDVFSTIAKVATSAVPVLILGESGTGKELAARAIHHKSERKDGPFIPINCGAISENLLESELFGHEKGSFTGAHAQRQGRVELAQGGTLFLDEIGEIPLALQVKLLRFLQEYRIERVGGRQEIPIDTRVIATTNRDLPKAIQDGQFREDLYYRIGVVVLSLPRLQERDGDIKLLAHALLQKYAAENKKKVTGFTKEALRSLETHDWPGNVRELENRLKRAVVMADGNKVTAANLELATGQPKYAGLGLKAAREAVEREMVQHAITRNGGNLTQTAAELGISRPTLYELMGKLGIERGGEKGG